MKKPICEYHATGRETRCRIFGLGFTRQATRSLFIAVKKLGFKAMHGFGGCELCMRDAEEKFRLGQTDYDVYKSYQASFQVASIHWQRLVEERPDAKFILPIRPLSSWFRSCRLKCRTAQFTHRNLDWFWLERWALFGASRFDSHVWIQRWLEHIGRVVTVLGGTGRLLIMNVFTQPDEVLWEQLSDFLKCPKPSEPFPHKHAPIRIRKHYA